MLLLRRLVRFAVNPADARAEATPAASNGFAGVPAMRGLGRHYELEITCRGDADPQTGYFLDIKFIDKAARQAVIPHITAACHDTPHADPAQVLAGTLSGLNAALGGTLVSIRWMLSPFYSVELAMTTPNAANPATATLRQRFEIAAAHRLHAPSLGDEANRAFFGKCNNPSGHGHNYIIEPAVSVPLSGTDAGRFSLAMLEQLVDRAIIQPFDHKHLNIDCPEFNQSLPGGVNPSAENIARVFYDKLAPLISASGTGATLQSVRLWETEKTSAMYPG